MQVPAALIGCEVWQIAFDYQTTLHLVGRNPDGSKRVSAHLIIGTPFVLRDAHGVLRDLDPTTSRSALAPVIDLFFKTVTSLAVGDHGTLTLDFDDGAQLVVPLDEQYESWEPNGQGISGVLVGPGGETDWRD
jgi:hypothetical protein